ncbi:hypothetical protein BJV85_002821 [Clostridium acetobutylicum]|uniref:Uncharacterized protein n=1 Tax=Clostridium acetobutylicum (strain ATCC 824 / DSM 792 / JCM 1419 / IAM 19013 / LMG 5710 / NBRC 13948 / NRRL B-527 / VKM B-1787 / 2291 / W) TaxID=272562 RepID=Q97JU7_CLOAB|nr:MULTISPECIES: hypothetical protein [Clostridium]AAK79148.1 Hypothetical protein CA_C1176 [Clostridium acetobutylicum ATCC 824]ADZ20226.1 Conserved hypothetical protein [Clostridium acetobutylicum EA 2018]AEI31683.1 hypothetical protein SMB_G1196 [Clostridium acetobutylicum DSM 1731]AWV81599.1 hypothetical protein DK921_16170 [Clostridium acetobutylicum]MBC2393240.1 hypothetical protein [Clostridium acetobutylicum]
MNRRQVKKISKNINKRIRFFNAHLTMCSKRNDKTILYRNINKACYSKKYKPFKLLKKVYEKIFLAIDLWSGKDYSVETIYEIKDGSATLIKTSFYKKREEI